MAPSCMLSQGGWTGCTLELQTWHKMMINWWIPGWRCNELPSSHLPTAPHCSSHHTVWSTLILVNTSWQLREETLGWLKTCGFMEKAFLSVWRAAGSWWGAQVNLLPGSRNIAAIPETLCIVFHNNPGFLTACSPITSPKWFPPGQGG